MNWEVHPQRASGREAPQRVQRSRGTAGANAGAQNAGASVSSTITMAKTFSFGMG